MVVQVVQILTNLLIAAIVARSLLSWFVRDPSNPLVILLNQITEPILAPLRSVMPRMGMMDLTPMVAVVILILIQQLVTSYFAT